MKAAFCKNLESVEIRDIAEPTIGLGDLLIRVTHCGICGSDIIKLIGEGLETPLTLGHEVAGVIEKTGGDTDGFAVGDRVVVTHHVPCFDCHYCRHENYSMCREFKKSNLDPGGFAEKLRIPATHVKAATFKMPTSLSEMEAIFTEPLACCLRCVKRLPLLPYDTVVLVGFGSIGILLHALLKRLPTEVIVLDLDPERLKLAKWLNIMALNPFKEDVQSVIREKTAGRGSDVVLFTAGSREMLNQAFNWVRDGGTLCLFSELTGQKTDPIDSRQIYKREITINSSYSPAPEDLREAFELIASQEVKLDFLKSHSFKLEEIPQAIRQVLDRKLLKAIICPQSN